MSQKVKKYFNGSNIISYFSSGQGSKCWSANDE